jgi:hypothetical protein
MCASIGVQERHIRCHPGGGTVSAAVNRYSCMVYLSIIAVSRGEARDRKRLGTCPKALWGANAKKLARKTASMTGLNRLERLAKFLADRTAFGSRCGTATAVPCLLDQGSGLPVCEPFALPAGSRLDGQRFTDLLRAPAPVVMRRPLCAIPIAAIRLAVPSRLQ